KVGKSSGLGHGSSEDEHDRPPQPWSDLVSRRPSREFAALIPASWVPGVILNSCRTVRSGPHGLRTTHGTPTELNPLLRSRFHRIVVVIRAGCQRERSRLSNEIMIPRPVAPPFRPGHPTANSRVAGSCPRRGGLSGGVPLAWP